MFRSLSHYSWVSISIRFVCIFAALQIISAIGQLISSEIVMHNAIDNVEHRIALDVSFLDVGNHMLHTPANKSAISRYLTRINTKLETESYPIRVASIANVDTSVDENAFPRSKSFEFTTAEQTIVFSIRQLPLFSAISFSYISLAFAIALTPLVALPRRKNETTDVESPPVPAEPRLIINLNDKTIGNGVNDVTVTLQNKPLCFYTALVQYCSLHPTQNLHPHKDVPNELTMLANKTFTRLIELGHTKRKRPDFNANLDKTLSEIRATLDEVFASFPKEKTRFYPPRAQGEGSRSKLHSYALTELQPDDVEIIGN